MVTKREIESNDVVPAVGGGDHRRERPGANGTWIYRPPVATRRMDVEVVSYATVRDAIGTKSVTLELADGSTVEDALRELAGEYDGLGALLFESDGGIRPHVNVLVGEENIRALDGGQTVLADGDTVGLAPGVSGGTVTEGERA